MKIKGLLYFVIPALLFSSCVEEEAALEPSNIDQDRISTQIDLSNETIKRIYNDYNVGLLYEYDTTKDFAYVGGTETMAQVWEAVEIPMIKSLYVDETGGMSTDTVSYYQEHLDGALTFLDTTLFSCFDPEGMIASKMPYKVLLSASVYTESQIRGLSGSVLTESDSRYGSKASGPLRSAFNDHSIVFAMDMEHIANSTDKYVKENFYAFFSRIIGMHELYNAVPAAFFEGKESYYNQEMEGLFREENGYDEEDALTLIDKDWFYSKGFVDAQYFYELSSYKYLKDENNQWVKHIKPLEVAKTPEFAADEFEDVRAYLNEMIHRDASELEAFPENIKDNMRLLLDTFEGWGVNVKAINPDLEVLN
ncbi:hypothetical protein V6R21_26675 [Limibacter armeniacum]|uniref:hypothetical protein n=1 Tax=Limibacter armeniacum TaxID=466084 RepID=UPI002FE681E5